MKSRNRILIASALSAGLTAGAFAQAQKDWKAPDISKLPDDKYGQSVRQGKALMEETYKHIGPEVKDAAGQVESEGRFSGAQEQAGGRRV